MWIVAPFNNSITTNDKKGTIRVTTTTKPILSVVSFVLIVLIKLFIMLFLVSGFIAITQRYNLFTIYTTILQIIFNYF